jgi:hypothetical protein
MQLGLLDRFPCFASCFVENEVNRGVSKVGNPQTSK